MDNVDYILNKFNLNFDDKTRMPIEIRDFDREGMASLFQELGFKIGAEIGVRGGGYSAILCRAIPGVRLYGVDPYVPHKGYLDHTRKSTFDKFHEEAKARLAPYENYHFIEKFSLDAVKDFANNSLDFVYIDGNHDFYNVTADITFWSEKVRPGGIISGDDFFKHKGPSRIHVYQVVKALAVAYSIRPWFVLGADETVPGEKRDSGRSWMWVKQ